MRVKHTNIGKSGKKAIANDLEQKLISLTGYDYASVNKKSADYDEFVRRIIGFCKKPSRNIEKKKVLDIARERGGFIGMKNFYRLSEFMKSETGEISEISLYNHTETIEQLRTTIIDYITRNTPKEAIVYMVSFEKDNGKKRKINNVLLHRAKNKYSDERLVIHGSDMPVDKGIMQFYVKEKDVFYAFQIDVKRKTPEELRAEKAENDGCSWPGYTAVVKALLGCKYPIEFQNIVTSEKS